MGFDLFSNNQSAGSMDKAKRPSNEDLFVLVAGAGFEPTTSGL